MKYEKEYYNWQKNVGVLGGILNLFKFEDHIDKEDIVVDFGSGGGYLLENLVCKEKVGIEINEVARKDAAKRGVKSVPSIKDIRDNYTDVIISNHALEHVENPLKVLKELRTKLKEDGKIIFVVPHDSYKSRYNPDDVNKHLYTWNRQLLGNLFEEAGFKILEVSNIRSKWPPHYQRIYKIFGPRIFLFISYLYAIIKNSYQIKIVAKK